MMGLNFTVESLNNFRGRVFGKFKIARTLKFEGIHGNMSKDDRGELGQRTKLEMSQNNIPNDKNSALQIQSIRKT